MSGTTRKDDEKLVQTFLQGVWKRVFLFATIGLGISDFVYRIIILFVSVVSGMNSVYELGAQAWL